MSRLTRDGTAEPVSRDQIILRRERGTGKNIRFPLQLTTTKSRISNFTRLIHTLLYGHTIQYTGRQPDTVANLARGQLEQGKLLFRAYWNVSTRRMPFLNFEMLLPSRGNRHLDTLNRKWRTSPSLTTYSLPSLLINPFSLATFSLPHATRSSNVIVSARIKPLPAEDHRVPTCRRDIN